MSKKQKPRYNWDEGYSPDGYQWPTLFDWDYEELSKTLNTTSLSEEVRAQLQEAVRIFFEWKDYTKHKPRRSEVISNLKKIEKFSKKLIDVLDEIDSLTLKALFETEPFNLTRSFLPLPPFFKKDATNNYGLFDDDADFRKIHIATKEALKILGPDKGGPNKTNIPYHYLILELATTYREITGHPATITWNQYRSSYSGPFFNFVDKFIEIIKEQTWSEISLGSQIKRTLKQNTPAK